MTRSDLKQAKLCQMRLKSVEKWLENTTSTTPPCVSACQRCRAMLAISLAAKLGSVCLEAMSTASPTAVDQPYASHLYMPSN